MRKIYLWYQKFLLIQWIGITRHPVFLAFYLPTLFVWNSPYCLLMHIFTIFNLNIFWYDKRKGTKFKSKFNTPQVPTSSRIWSYDIEALLLNHQITKRLILLDLKFDDSKLPTQEIYRDIFILIYYNLNDKKSSNLLFSLSRLWTWIKEMIYILGSIYISFTR